jgi:Protein of unknown function (DUF3300)
MKPLSSVCPAPVAPPFSLSHKSASPPSQLPAASAPAFLQSDMAALVLLVAALAMLPPQASAQYASPPYIQAAPNYVTYPQTKPSPYGYPAQPAPQAQQYEQQQYPQSYPQQPQQYAQPQYPGPIDQQYPQQPEQYAPQPQQAAQPFAAEQLEQLVAPIALYPDSLVAQILAASTYPAQVIAADNWLHAQGYASPDQIAYGADAQTKWDPSIKALTAFPQVLDLMNRDLHWTTDLGNAYYNQPQDVLQTIQVMRQRAEDAGNLQSTPQEQVSYNQGYIQLAPPNPQVVYVPAYNPWTAYGQPVSPYPGFSFSGVLGAIGSVLGNGMRFGSGIGMAAFSHTPFGWAGWVLNWLASNILFHQSPYQSQSTSVAHWGNSGGGYYGGHGGGPNRNPNRFPQPLQGGNRLGNGYAQGNGYARGNEYARTNGYVQPAFTRPPVRTAENYGYNRGVEAPNRAYAGGYGRPAQQNYGYIHPQPEPTHVQSYGRAGGYGNGFDSNSQQAYAARPAMPYAGQQTGRAPASNYQRNEFAQRSNAEPRSYGGSRNFAESAPKQSGGFHMFGGGHGEEHYRAPKAMKAPKAPKMSGGGGGHRGGGLFGHHGR